MQVNTDFSLDNVLLDIEEVLNWRDVVLHLGVPKDVVDGIMSTYKAPEAQKRKAFSWWIENSDKASWKELANALLNSGYRLLAARIKIERGTYVLYLYTYVSTYMVVQWSEQS